jgi:uncharacterized Fe-S radical SAM superfamily protein PflX
MTVESDILEKDMRDKLDIAAQEGCTPKGHGIIINFLVMSHQLHLDTRKAMKDLPMQVTNAIGEAMKQYQPNMLEFERNGMKLRINGKEAVAKIIKYGTAAIFALYVLGKVHGWGGASMFNVKATPEIPMDAATAACTVEVK